ncbi:MAG TPA: alpha/beta hydrolase-fold protein [Chroococcales cyanobacterium]|jgi:predicted alpha/beta superfamily hydrolase
MGNIQIIRDFYSPLELAKRTIRIFTPDAYYQQPSRRFPVVYVFNGQNVFAHPESSTYNNWGANTQLDTLVDQGSIPPWIIVGIDHLTNRVAEYSPWQGGRGLLSADFLVNRLKPYIDSSYRTLSEPYWTAVMGASLGGSFSLFLGKKYPHIFGRIGSISPPLTWGSDRMFDYWDSHTHCWSKILLQVGSREQYSFYGICLDYFTITAEFYRHLQRLGYHKDELRFLLAKKDLHPETACQKQLPEIMRWLLNEPHRVQQRSAIA